MHATAHNDRRLILRTLRMLTDNSASVLPANNASAILEDLQGRYVELKVRFAVTIRPGHHRNWPAGNGAEHDSSHAQKLLPGWTPAVMQVELIVHAMNQPKWYAKNLANSEHTVGVVQFARLAWPLLCR